MDIIGVEILNKERVGKAWQRDVDHTFHPTVGNAGNSRPRGNTVVNSLLFGAHRNYSGSIANGVRIHFGKHHLPADCTVIPDGGGEFARVFRDPHRFPISMDDPRIGAAVSGYRKHKGGEENRNPYRSNRLIRRSSLGKAIYHTVIGKKPLNAPFSAGRHFWSFSNQCMIPDCASPSSNKIRVKRTGSRHRMI